MARRKFPLYGLLAMLAASILTAASGNQAKASGHGDSVFAVESPSSAITDFYMFRSFESGQQDKLIFIMNVRPFQEPGAGPVYYPFDSTVTYNINVDNDQDGVADNIVYQIRFKTQFQSPFNNLPISYSNSGLSSFSSAGGTATASGAKTSTVVLSNTTTTAATSAATSGTTVVMTPGTTATTTPTTATPTTETQGSSATGVTVTGAATNPSSGITIVNPGTTTTGTTGTTGTTTTPTTTAPTTTTTTGTTSTGTPIGTTSTTTIPTTTPTTTVPTTTTPTTTVPTTTVPTTTVPTTTTTTGTTTSPTVVVPSTGTTTTGSPGAMLDFRPAVPRLSLNTPRILSASPATGEGILVAQASTTGTTVVVPGGITGTGITALSGTGSEGIGLKQTYAVKKLTKTPGSTNFTETDLGTGTMIVVPPRVGPSTTPDYETLSSQGIFPLANGGRVFAGPRDDTFYADLGAMFDTFNFRAGPVLSASQDASDTTNPTGFDTVSGYNVSSIIIEIPITDITFTSNMVIGAYASTTRSQTTTLMGNGNATTFSGPQVQVSRAGNPLVADLMIPNSQKTLWNMSNPSTESQFLTSYQNPSLAQLLNSQLGIAVPNVRRDDLTAVFLKYPGQDPSACSAGNGCSELLRLNLAIPPTPPGSQSRLGSLNQVGANPGSPDPAGWPNGRRPGDDVVDIFLRLIAGARLNAVPALGDGVNFNIGAEGSNLTPNGIKDRFPFLPIPHDGRDRRHIDPGESQ